LGGDGGGKVMFYLLVNVVYLKGMQKTKKMYKITVIPPVIYFIGLVLGFILNLLLPIKIIPQGISYYIGIPMLLIAPIIILWAQSTSRKFNSAQTTEKPEGHGFKKGPYAFTRNPTYLGLTILVAGFGFLIDSFWVIGTSLISFFIVYFVVLKKEEKLLEEKHGEKYLQYKKEVRSWL
jgi:protein-S-isoprenylcysteine O-methyltransferase Ste14